MWQECLLAGSRVANLHEKAERLSDRTPNPSKKEINNAEPNT